MKLIDLLETDYTFNSTDQAQEYINRDCTKFLQLGVNLYRIEKSKNAYGDIKHTKPNRKPTETMIKLHNVVDKYFNKTYGAKWRSNNVVFCLGSIEAREEYRYENGFAGNIVKIFPIGNFEYLWSPNVSDLYDTLQDKLNITDYYEPEKFKPQTIEWVFRKIKYFNNDIKKWATKYPNHEMMVRTQSYYSIPI